MTDPPFPCEMCHRYPGVSCATVGVPGTRVLRCLACRYQPLHWPRPAAHPYTEYESADGLLAEQRRRLQRHRRRLRDGMPYGSPRLAPLAQGTQEPTKEIDA